MLMVMATAYFLLNLSLSASMISDTDKLNKEKVASGRLLQQ